MAHPGDMTSPRGGPSSTADRGGPVIAVGIDGSPTSWDAFSWALGEAGRTHASIIAVYVTPIIEPTAALGPPFAYALAEQCRSDIAAELQVEAEQRVGELGVPLTFVRAYGGTVHALMDVVQSAHVDLIVVGKSSGMLHHFAGSLGRQLVSRRNAPAIVVVP
jgi:nucleotide-binding universal stress UspA family protein